MKKIISLIIVMFSCITFSQNLNGKLFEIKYDKYFDINEDKFYQYFSNSSNEDIVERNKYNFTKIDNYVLISDCVESVFNKIAKINNSQTLKDHIRTGEDEVVFYSGSGLVLYKNIKEKFSLIPTKDDEVMIQDSLFNFKWNLNYSEERKILGYKVNKATTSGLEPDTTVTVWYTKEIPYENGPDIYWGVPGLILQIDIKVDSKVGLAYFINSYHYKATNIKKILKTKEFDKNIRDNKTLTRDEYQEKKSNLLKKQQEYNNYQGVDTSD